MYKALNVHNISALGMSRYNLKTIKSEKFKCIATITRKRNKTPAEVRSLAFFNLSTINRLICLKNGLILKMDQALHC